MSALLAALLLMPVRPLADAPGLVAELGHGKPLVLHFFASWCGACRVEFPHIRQVLLDLKGPAEVVLVTIDRPEDIQKAEEMLKRYKLTSLRSLLLDAPDPDPVAKAVGEPKWDGTLPSTFVYDASGKLVRSFLGRANPAELKAAAQRTV
ncbi:MAG: TlpA family protein disulfide reductase, partial [Myxococcales bacterium]|nr:TlpA family protein disulfide reductase [Myxococcales bacterium]